MVDSTDIILVPDDEIHTTVKLWCQQYSAIAKLCCYTELL